MPRERIKLSVFIDLDPVPGAMHTAASAHQHVLLALQDRFPSYNPEVNFEGLGMVEPQYIDRAIFIRKQDTSPGGDFFMNDQAIVGWWCVRSTDPAKKDLFLPPYIFRKCFQGSELQMDEGWSTVKEIV